MTLYFFVEMKHILNGKYDVGPRKKGKFVKKGSAFSLWGEAERLEYLITDAKS